VGKTNRRAVSNSGTFTKIESASECFDLSVPAAQTQEALCDFLDGLRSRSWWAISVNDLRGRYRRTILGPWWLVLGTGISLSAMGIVWATLFGMDLRTFFPYLIAGYITYVMWSSFLTEGCSTFTNGAAASIQRNINLPKTVHPFRLVARTFLLFLHNLVLFLIVAAIFSTPATAWTLLVIPALFVTLLNGIWVSIVFGILGARFRDIEPIIGALMTFVFLVTPVMWRPAQLGTRRFIADFNPLTHFLDIVREPLLGQPPSLTSWEVVLGITICGYVVSFFLFRAYRTRITFWL